VGFLVQVAAPDDLKYSAISSFDVAKKNGRARRDRRLGLLFGAD
jgi:hypothetical protein